MLTVEAAKRNFFDRAAVINAIGRSKARLLSKGGAYVRTDARGSMKRRKYNTTAPAGSPPFAHSSDPFASLKNILFSWDPITESVVVGPVKLNLVSFVGAMATTGLVPQVQEFGGRLGTYEYQHWNGQWYRADLRSRRRFAGRPQRIRQATYPKRPFMGPALNRTYGKIPELWRNAALRGM